MQFLRICVSLYSLHFIHVKIENKNQRPYKNIKDQWLRHYTCSGICKTSYHLLISPPPTNLANTLKIHTGENKIDRQSRMWRHYTCYFPANGSTNPDFFTLKPSLSQKESSFKTANPSDLKSRGMIPLGMQNVLG